MAKRLTDTTTALFRAVIGLLFAIHGAASLFGIWGGVMGTGQSEAVGAWPGWWAAIIQLAAGVLVILGLGTRAAALLASGSMAYAYFSMHAPAALFPHQNGGEMAALFSWSFLMIAALGPGRWALSSLFLKSSTIEAIDTPAPQQEYASVS